MHFNFIRFVQGTVLTWTFRSAAAPTNGTNTATTAILAATTTVPAPAATVTNPAVVTLSLTQRLALADSTADRINMLPDNSDFVFDFQANIKPNGGKGGNLVLATRKSFPALVGTGGGIAFGFLGPCGFNTPHVHLRAAELQTVIQGRLITEHVPENGVVWANGTRRVITNTINLYQMQPFYQGAVHTEFNPDCTDTVFLSAFPHEDFGVGQIADEYFALSDDVIRGTLGNAIDGAEIDNFRAHVSQNVAAGVEECLAKCGIPKMKKRSTAA